jgi:hypothetical protein
LAAAEWYPSKLAPVTTQFSVSAAVLAQVVQLGAFITENVCAGAAIEHVFVTDGAGPRGHGSSANARSKVVAERTEQHAFRRAATISSRSRSYLRAVQVVFDMTVVHAGLPLNGVLIQFLGRLIHFNSRPWLCRGSYSGSRMLVVGLWLGARRG